MTSTNETQLSKGDYLKKFQTLMYVNSKYFNLQKFFENKKQLNMQNSEENFEKEIKILNKKRKKRKISRLLREEKKTGMKSMDKFRLFRKKKKSGPSFPGPKSRFSSMDRGVVKPGPQAKDKHASRFPLFQSQFPVNSPKHRFSVTSSLLNKKKINFKLPHNHEAPVITLKPPPKKQNPPVLSDQTSIQRKKGKSVFLTSNKIKQSINMIRKKCTRL